MTLDLQTLLTLVLVIQIGLLEFFILRNVISLRQTFSSTLRDFRDPSRREGLFREIAHGVMRALGERQGALKGAASRQMEGALTSDVSGLAISGLASFLPKKYQAFAPLIAPYIQQFIERGQPLLGGQNGQGPGSSQGQPP